jgi:LuxR family transcriptional regulator, maltose regulon positive regulatory protein
MKAMRPSTVTAAKEERRCPRQRLPQTPSRVEPRLGVRGAGSPSPAPGRRGLTHAHRLRPLLDHGVPWLSVAVGLELTRAHLTLADARAARTVFAETGRVLEVRPHMGSRADDARELRPRVEATAGSTGAWAMSLTAAELRLLPFLATHLTFPEIASRLFITRNTVKSEAVAVYRKLGVASRSDAIERAVQVGLLESSIYPPSPGLTLRG